MAKKREKKSKLPKQIFVTLESSGTDDQYFDVNLVKEKLASSEYPTEVGTYVLVRSEIVDRQTIVIKRLKI